MRNLGYIVTKVSSPALAVATWLRGIATKTGDNLTRFPDSPPSPPLSAKLEQKRRIWLKAARYRHAFAEARKAQQAREEQAERDRVQQARDAYEDAFAKWLALRNSYFPGDAEQEREPRIEVLPFQVPQQWLDFQREASDWRGGRG